MKMRLSARLVSTYLAVGLIPLAVIGGISWTVASGNLGAVSNQGATALESAAYEQLLSMRETKAKQVKQYFAERQADMSVLTENVKAVYHRSWENLAGIQETKRNDIVELMRQMSGQLDTLSKSHVLDVAFADFKAYHDASGTTATGPLDVSSEAYAMLYEKWHDEFSVYVDNYGYYDIFFLCAAHGHVLFTEAQESDLGANVGAGPLKEEGLGTLWRTVTETGKPAVQDFEPYSPSNGAQAAFMGAPVLNDAGKMVAVVALQMPSGPINDIVQTRAGLGQTGETYLVGRHEGKTGFRSDLVTMGDGKYVVGAEIQTDYIDKAIAGASGEEVFFDSAGNPVMVCYEPLALNGLNWAQITKMDMEECFSLKGEGDATDFFAKYNDTYGYYDLFLFQPNGYCFYSVGHEPDYKTNLVSGLFADSGLGEAVQGVLSAKDFVFADFAPYEPSGGVPAGFIAQPVVNNGEVEVVVALQLSDTSISTMMATGSNKERMLEAYLVGPEGYMRSNSILNPEDYSLAASFAEGNTVETEATHSALSGGSDSKVIEDYLGSQVLSAWAPLDIFGTPWALVCEIDEAVAMAARTEMADTSADANQQLVMWILGGLVTAAVLVAVIAWLIARSISKPLNSAVNLLTSGAEQVASASGQVAQSSQSMAEGASEQASSLEETSASLEELTSMTRQNTENSTEAKSLAEQAQSDADTGSASMGRMSQAIDAIKKSADETAGIVKTIEEIAFQTNLLALNAAVEAARAGDAGKGFAVVAEEVRNLAQRAAEAARNTSDLISGSVTKAEGGVTISREVAEALSKIAEGTRKVNMIAGEVAAASKEQAQGIEQINTAVTQMDQVTQQNAANSEEGASAAEELSAQSAEMMKVVEDLAALVNGSAQARHEVAPVKATTTRSKAHSPFGRPSVATARPKVVHKEDTRELATAGVGASGGRATHGREQILPLDDVDFEDF